MRDPLQHFGMLEGVTVYDTFRKKKETNLAGMTPPLAVLAQLRNKDISLPNTKALRARSHCSFWPTFEAAKRACFQAIQVTVQKLKIV